MVPPHTGGWIEMLIILDELTLDAVPPHTGGWIEII